MNKKIIYKFSTVIENEVEKEVEIKKKNKATGKEESNFETKIVKEETPFDITIYQPSRRQVEDADMEFSIEMSRCIKKGILTKAMLSKKYSDSGGLLSEEDSDRLLLLYRKLSEVNGSISRLNTKSKKTKNDKEEEGKLTEQFAALRKEIVNLETSYQNVFNHTADTKAQNKTILWYLLNLTYYNSEGEEPQPLFPGETLEEKEDSYYEQEEEENSLFAHSKEKLMTFVSFWYFSQNSTPEEFENLEKEIEEGKL